MQENKSKLRVRRTRTLSRRVTLVGILVMIGTGTIWGEGLGGLSGAHLRSAVGADVFARGGANAASPEYLCMWSNPATLVLKDEKTVVVGSGYRMLGRTEAFASYEFKVPPRVGLGFSLLYRGDLSLTNLYDADENKLEDGRFTTLAFKIGLSYLTGRKLTLGLNYNVHYLSMPTAGHDGTLQYSTGGTPVGFDLAGSYRYNQRLSFGLVVKNLFSSLTLNAKRNDEDENFGFQITLEDRLTPSIVFGSELRGSLLNRPFKWNCDIEGYLIDGWMEALYHKQIVIDNGWEWQGWDGLYLRAGLSDFTFNTDLIDDSELFWDTFSWAVTAGIFLDASSVIDGLHLNYAVSTHKIWAGVEQQLDFVYSF